MPCGRPAPEWPGWANAAVAVKRASEAAVMEAKRRVVTVNPFAKSDWNIVTGAGGNGSRELQIGWHGHTEVLRSLPVSGSVHEDTGKLRGVPLRVPVPPFKAC